MKIQRSNIAILTALLYCIDLAAANDSIADYTPDCSYQSAKAYYGNSGGPENEGRFIHQQFSTHSGQRNYRIQAVFDGHGGSEISEYLRKHFASHIHAALSRVRFEGDIDEIKKALQTVIYSIDRGICESNLGETGGSTATFAIHDQRADRLIIGNVGNSRTLITRTGKDGVVFATKDHKPSDPKEEQHIIEKGGKVLIGRVNRILGISRSFGDCDFKVVDDLFDHYEPEGLVRITPDFEVIDQIGDQQLIVLSASGRLFNLVQNEAIARYLAGLNGNSFNGACWEIARESDPLDDISLVISRFTTVEDDDHADDSLGEFMRNSI